MNLFLALFSLLVALVSNATSTSFILDDCLPIYSNHMLRNIPATNQFSVMFWLRLDKPADSHWRSIVHKGHENWERTFAMWLYPNQNKLHARISTSKDKNEGCDPELPLKVNGWTHVAYVADKNKLTVYINGQVGCKKDVGEIMTNSGPLYIGDPWHAPTNGLIAHFSYNDRVLSQQEVQQHMNLKGHLRNERSINRQCASPDVATKQVTGSLYFPQCLRITKGRRLFEPSIVKPSARFTLSFYLKINSQKGPWRSIIHHGNHDGERTFGIWQYPDTNKLHFRVTTKKVWNDGCDPHEQIPLGQWTHIAVQFDGQKKMQVLFDGKKVCENTKLENIETFIAPTFISDPWHENASGSIAEIFYETSWLSTTKLKELTKRKDMLTC